MANADARREMRIEMHEEEHGTFDSRVVMTLVVNNDEVVKLRWMILS